jgi:hypothetical protein
VAAVIVTESMRRGERLRWLVEEHLAPMHRTLDALLRDGVERGVFRDIAAVHVTQSLVAAAAFFFTAAPLVEALYEVEVHTLVDAHAEAIVALALDGLVERRLARVEVLSPEQLADERGQLIDAYLRDLFCLLPSWPRSRVLELAPSSWKQTLQQNLPVELLLVRSIQETLRELWHQPSIDLAVTHWRRWHAWARRSRLAPIKKAALTVKSHIANILTYFRHKITNSTAEGINALIDAIQRLSRGFRNPEHFKTAIYFHCGGLHLTPALSAAH